MAARTSVLTRVLFQLPMARLALAAIVVGVLQLLPRSSASAPDTKPQPAAPDEQHQFNATPGGRYTAAVIRANGDAPAAEKYRRILASHHLHPAAGERICPVTHTRANPRIAWTVDGQDPAGSATVSGELCPALTAFGDPGGVRRRAR